MYLPIIIAFQLTVFVCANPFHKYPFVFLLDVGNEELDKTNTEQIRVSVPGGSLALKYPAVGNGDTIAHVRVSGIDFGTDLKAEIIDGGPGKDYVILVFMGNPGVAYDAVITIQTVPDGDGDESMEEAPANEENQPANQENLYRRQFYKAADESAKKGTINYEDISPVPSNIPTDSELTQASSHDYNYAANQDFEEDGDAEIQNNDESLTNTADIDDGQVSNYLLDNNMALESFSDEDPNNQSIAKAEPLSVDASYDGEEEQGIGDLAQYKQDEEYPSGDIVSSDGSSEDKSAENKDLDDDQEDPVELDQMFNDEEVHNDAAKNTDDNNNTYDTDESNAVEY